MEAEREETLKPEQQPEQNAAPVESPPGVQAAPTRATLSTDYADESRVRVQLEVPEGVTLQVEVEARTTDGRLLGREALVFGSPSTAGQRRALPGSRPAAFGTLVARLTEMARAQAAALPAWLMWLSLGIYAFTRLFHLPSFPIYFFTDEAIQTMQAADLLRDHLLSPYHELLPTYFENGTQFNLSTSVYLQILPYLLFGKSIWVTRGVAALMTLIAAVSVGLIFKKIFKSPYPWLAVLFLAVTPAWFLHSRTAFETALATSFYAAFLYCYMMYRDEHPRYLYGAVALGALTFYTYSPMRMVMLVTALLLILSDARYHWLKRRTLLRAFGLALLLTLPFVRFLINHPDANLYQMRLLGSYWITDISLTDKLNNFFTEYFSGLDPIYWYLPQNIDLSRHVMLGYGHLLRQTLPLGLFGVALALRHVRSSPHHRTLLIAVLAAPAGAALVKVGITRLLVMVIPMAILTALAVQWIMEWLHRRKISRTLLSLVVFAALAFTSLYMLRDALVNGPTWYHDYSMTGLQYGAKQIFGEVKDYLARQPDTHLIVSPSWANGTDVVARFFFDDPLPFELGSVQGYFDEVKPLEDTTLFVMIPEEYNNIPTNRFKDIRVEKTVAYPDGQPGFYFVRMKYVDNIQEVMQQEEAERRKPVTDLVQIGAVDVNVTHTRLDIGSLSELFDGNPTSLIRTWMINPMQLTFDFPIAHAMNGIVLRVGGTETAIWLQVWEDGQTEPVVLTQSLPGAVDPRDTRLEFGREMRVKRLEIEITNVNDPPNTHVHLWEVTFSND